MRGSILFSIVLSVAIAASAFAAPHGIVPTKQQRFLNQILRDRTETSGTKVVYYGGPVLANVKVYTVYWGKNVDSTVTSQIGGFFSATVNSTYLDWLKEYDTNIKAVDGRQGTNQHVGRGSYAGEFTITPKNTGAFLNDPDVQV